MYRKNSYMFHSNPHHLQRVLYFYFAKVTKIIKIIKLNKISR